MLVNIERLINNSFLFQGLALDKDFIKMLRNQLFLPKKIVNVVKWLLVSLGGLGCVTAFVYHYKGNNILKKFEYSFK